VRGDCHLKHVTEGKIEEMGGRGRRRKQLLDGLQETNRYWILKVKALGFTFWKLTFKGTIGLSKDRLRDDDEDDDADRHLERILLYDKNLILSMRLPFLPS
jgi:hypothetical protein